MVSHNWVAKITKQNKGFKSLEKVVNSTVNQDGDKDAPEDNADKIDKEESDKEQENNNEEK